MILAIRSLVFLTVVSVSTSTHTQSLTTLRLVTRARTHTTLAFSTAHTFLCRWYVRLVRMTSSHGSALRLVMAWSRTHLLALLLQVVWLLLRRINTIGFFASTTSWLNARLLKPKEFSAKTIKIAEYGGSFGIPLFYG